MPPRKKKPSKTPPKTKSPSPSPTDSPSFQPEPEPQPEPQPQPEPEPEPETTTVSPEKPVPAERKKVLRVRKVVKKKIVKKLVPKKTDDVSEKDANPNSVLEEDSNPNASQKQEVVRDLVDEEGGLGIKEECDRADGKDVIFKTRKVVRKKIVKKLVPKAASLAALPQQDKIFESNSSSMDTAFLQQEVKMEEDEKVEENVEVNEECGQVEVKDEILLDDEGSLGIKEECDEVDGKDGIFKTRKVVRKRIVKKLVSKGSLVALPQQDKIFDSNSSLLDTTFQEDSQQPQEGKMEEDKNVEDSVEINEECGQIEVKDEILEGGKDGDGLEVVEAKENEAMGLSERMKRRKSEIFIGGLDRDAKEEDIRSVFGKVGEILELRMMMDGQTGKNKGYAFLRYVEPSQAKRAVTEFAKVEIRGKICGAAAVQGNDVIFLGNIDKKWKKEDVMKLLMETGIENIDTITVVMDPNNTDSNRGFAFVELETNRDAQRAYKKLQKKDVLGKCRNIKVAWADSFNIPDEEDMLKVKSVYAEGVPDSWDEERLKEVFKKFGEIERIVLGRNIKSAKRRDIAFINYKTREAALSCIESFSSDELTDNGSKVNMKVALAKRVQKANQNKGQKLTVNNPLKETFKPAQGLPLQDYSPAVLGTKRPLSTLGDGMYSDFRGYPRARVDTSFGIAGSSYPMIPHGGVGSSLQYQQQPVPTGYSTGYSTDYSTGYSTGSFYRSGSNTDTHQIRQGVPPYSSNLYHRYQM